MGPRIGTEVAIAGTVRTVEALVPLGHLRITVDVPPDLPGASEAQEDALENDLVAYDTEGHLFGLSGAGAQFLAEHLLREGWRKVGTDA